MKYVQKRFDRLAVIRFMPVTLLLVIVTTLITYGGRLDQQGVRILGDVSGGFATPVLPDLTLDRMRASLGAALTISVLLFVESFVIGKTYAAKHNYPISPNRELVALGISNVFSSFFGAFSAGGSLARSKMNDALGAQTPLAGLIAAGVIFWAILFLLPVFYYLPSSSIAAIVFVAVSGLLNAHDALFMYRVRAWKDLALFFGMVIVTLALGPQYSIIFAFVACLALLVKNVAVVDPKLIVLGVLPASQRYVDVSEFPEAHGLEGILMLKMQGPLHFVI